MKLTDNRKLAVLMIFHFLWGLVLWFSISKYGLGISTDSVHLLFGAFNFSAGRGLISFDGSFLSNWPPLYPLLLAFVHRASGLNVFISANVLQMLAFIGLSFSLSLLFLKIFPDNFLLAFAGNAFSDIGVVLLTSFNIVGPDYVHLAFVVFFIWLAGEYLEHPSPRVFVTMFVVGMLAMLQRYLGLAVIVTGAAAVLFLSEGAYLQRITRSLLLSLSALPAGIWFVITSRSIERRAPISFTENFSWFSKSILEWFFPSEAVQAHLGLYIAGLWVLILGLVVWLFFSSSRVKLFSIYRFLVFIYGISYTLLLFGSASITYFNKLGGRFLLPLYIPFVTLITVAAEILLRRNSEGGERIGFLPRLVSASSIGVLVIIAGLLLQTTLPVILDSRANGAAGGENAFNTTTWHENDAINYWLSHKQQGKYLLFSNYSDGVAFYTAHACFGSPRQYSGPYGNEEFPLSQYATELFSSGQDVYIIWIEPNAYSYFYKVEDLSSIAEVQSLFVGRDGGVYRLKPLSGS